MTEKERKYHQMYMDISERISQMSFCERLKVGSICVKDGRIISMGWNGSAAGLDNVCEYTHYNFKDTDRPIDGAEYTTERKTHPSIIHAEANMLGKLAKYGESSNGSTVYITHAPCLECAKTLYVAGVKNIFYKYAYRDNSGVEFLNQFSEIKVIHFE